MASLKRDGKSYKGNWAGGKLELNEGETYDFLSGRIEIIQEKIENEDQLRELLNNDDKKRNVKRDRVLSRGNSDMGNLKMNKAETCDNSSGQILKQSQPKPIQTIKMVIKNEDQLRELLKNEEKKRSVKELVIDEGCGNEMNDDLELCGFDNLESIVVEKNTLKNLNSLKISDNPVLKNIETEDGDPNRDNGAFYYVKSVTITSTLIAD